MRTIDADELKKGIDKYFCNVCSEPEIGKCKACEVAEILSMIDDTPTTEAEPVKHGKWAISPRWISVKKRLPPDLQDVIVSDGNYVAMGYFMDLMGMWHIYGNSIPQHKESYTYWQLLPEPPERSKTID